MRLCSSNKYLFVLWGKWWYADEKYAKCIPLSGSFMILTILCKIYYAFVVKDVDLMSNNKKSNSQGLGKDSNFKLMTTNEKRIHVGT